MTEVIIAEEKHGTFTYGSALDLLKERTTDGYGWYDWPDGTQAKAEAIVERGDEDAAWKFLRSRRDHEYEWVEKSTIQGGTS